MNKINMILAGVCCCFGIFILLLIPSQVSTISTNDLTLGADFFPKFIGILLIIASIGLFAESFSAYRIGCESEAKIDSQWKQEMRVLIFFLLLVVYILALQSIGFIVASLVFGAIMMYLLGARTWWFYVIFIAGVFVTYYVFHYLLYVHLPSFKLFK